MKNRGITIMVILVLIFEIAIIFLLCSQMGLISPMNKNTAGISAEGDCREQNKCCRPCCCCRKWCCCKTCESGSARKTCCDEDVEPVPSKTTSDIGRVVKVKTLEGTETDSEFSVFIAEDTREVLDEITAIYKFVTEKDAAPINYFDAGVKGRVSNKLFCKTSLQELELNEFMTIQAKGYKHEYGETAVDFDLATQYEQGQSVVALVGIFADKDDSGRRISEWIVLDASVEDGCIRVVFTADCLEKINENPSAFAVMNTPKEKSN